MQYNDKSNSNTTQYGSETSYTLTRYASARWFVTEMTQHVKLFVTVCRVSACQFQARKRVTSESRTTQSSKRSITQTCASSRTSHVAMIEVVGEWR